MEAGLQCSGSTFGSFDEVSGRKQGCVLASALTAILMTAFSDCDAGVRKEYPTDGGLLNIRRFGAKAKVCDTIIKCLLCAGDCALFAHSEE